MQDLEYFRFSQSLLGTTVEKQQIKVVGLQAAEAPMDAPPVRRARMQSRFVLFFESEGTAKLALQTDKNPFDCDRAEGIGRTWWKEDTCGGCRRARRSSHRRQRDGGGVNQVNAEVAGGPKHAVQFCV